MITYILQISILSSILYRLTYSSRNKSFTVSEILDYHKPEHRIERCLLCTDVAVIIGSGFLLCGQS